nr:reverse transcriptase domain-containing protein [Tanacetum cinerariifolium]
MRPVAPPSPDYIPGLEELQTPPVSQDEEEREPMFIQPHDPDCVPEPMYPKYIPLEDEHVLPAEEQPLPPVDSPTAESPGYVVESDPEEDPEQYEDNKSEDGLVDYPIDGGDNEDDDDGDSFEDDADDEEEDEEDEEEEDEHLALADAIVVVPTVEPASISLPLEVEVERLLAMLTPPPSLLTSILPPSAWERLTRDDIPETKMPSRKRSCLVALGSRYEIEESSTARPTGGRGIDYGFVSTLDAKARRRGIREVGYGIKDTWVDPAETVPEIETITLREVNTRVTELAELHEHETQDLYALLEDAQDNRTRISQRVVHSEFQTHHEQVYALEFQLQAHQTQLQLQGILMQKQPWSSTTTHQEEECHQDLQYGIREIAKGNGCFECGAPRNLKRDCPKLKNKDGINVNAQGWVYAVGNAKTKGNASRNPDSNVVTGTFLLNNHYASIFFDIGVDRSFISTAFSSLIDIALTPLGNSYDVKLADGKIVRVNTIMWGYTLNFLNHPFNIDLMPVELSSFDVIIGMDWLRRCHTVIMRDEKLVRVPYGNETLIFRGDESNDGKESRLTIISCLKAQEYIVKGCQIFLA